MKTQAVIPAAGAGKRLGGERPKLLVELLGKPILIHTLEIFENCPFVDSVIVAVCSDYLSEYRRIISASSLKKIKSIVIGGSTRAESVARGLQSLDEKTEIVVIHDGARPLASPVMIQQAISQCQTCRAVVVGVPVKSTIKRVDPHHFIVKETLERKSLWEIQTPQVFQKDLIVEAYKKMKAVPVTDDASLVEQLGVPVTILPGEYTNIKITTEEDLILAETFLKRGIALNA